MTDETSTIEERLESLVARLCVDADGEAGEGVSIPLPVRFVTADGIVAIELPNDVDGGLICIKDLQGRAQVTIGSGLAGGWIDIHHNGANTLAVTLSANDEGGTIEYSANGKCIQVRGEPYWPHLELENGVE